MNEACARTFVRQRAVVRRDCDSTAANAHPAMAATEEEEEDDDEEDQEEEEGRGGEVMQQRRRRRGVRSSDLRCSAYNGSDRSNCWWRTTHERTTLRDNR